METDSIATDWETALAGFLARLSDVQQRTLDVLGRKRKLLIAGDLEGLGALAEAEAALVEELRQCLAERNAMLERAAREGLPAANLQAVASALPTGQSAALGPPLRQATLQARLLAHEGLLQWLLVQRTLLHLSQLLEIIATGGRLQPTYRKEESLQIGGALVDRAV